MTITHIAPSEGTAIIATGDAWTEEFASKRRCFAWLCGEFEMGEKEE